ncbi:hypothetical protein DFH09DRAFT_1273280 [Mycena vulgaris]|nr:hypothetical protein DFH09DRAFT_1273280 [Mycena vulgaris]
MTIGIQIIALSGLGLPGLVLWPIPAPVPVSPSPFDSINRLVDSTFAVKVEQIHASNTDYKVPTVKLRNDGGVLRRQIWRIAYTKASCAESPTIRTLILSKSARQKSAATKTKPAPPAPRSGPGSSSSASSYTIPPSLLPPDPPPAARSARRASMRSCSSRTASSVSPGRNVRPRASAGSMVRRAAATGCRGGRGSGGGDEDEGGSSVRGVGRSEERKEDQGREK